MEKRRKGLVALIALAFVFASMGVFARYLSTSLLLLQQVYLRIFAALVISLYLFRKDINISKIKKLPRREWLILAGRAFFFYLLGVTLFTKAITIAKYANVSFIGALPLTAFFGFIILKEKVTMPKILLLLTALFGSTILAVQDYSQLLVWGQGELIALASAAFFSLSYVMRPLQSKKLNNREITVLIFILGFLMVFFASLLSGESLPTPIGGWSMEITAVVIGAGIFNILNLYLVNYGFSIVETALASNILTLESLFAISIGFALYGEIPAMKELIGGIIIVLGVIGMNRVEANESKRK